MHLPAALYLLPARAREREGGDTREPGSRRDSGRLTSSNLSGWARATTPTRRAAVSRKDAMLPSLPCRSWRQYGQRCDCIPSELIGPAPANLNAALPKTAREYSPWGGCVYVQTDVPAIGLSSHTGDPWSIAPPGLRPGFDSANPLIAQVGCGPPLACPPGSTCTTPVLPCQLLPTPPPVSQYVTIALPGLTGDPTGTSEGEGPAEYQASTHL